MGEIVERPIRPEMTISLKKCYILQGYMSIKQAILPVDQGVNGKTKLKYFIFFSGKRLIECAFSRSGLREFHRIGPVVRTA